MEGAIAGLAAAGQRAQRGGRACSPARDGHRRFAERAAQRLPAAGGIAGACRARYHRVPVRGHSLRGAAARLERPAGQARHPRGNGRLPGPGVRAGAPAPLRRRGGHRARAARPHVARRPGRAHRVAGRFARSARMKQSDWAGVFPAITTPFRPDGAVDEPFLARHVAWLLDAGCRGVVALGSLGEGATLSFDEKVRVLEVCRTVTAGRVPLVASISGLATGGMRGAGQGGRRRRVRRPDGAAAVRVPRRLAGNGGALLLGARRHAALLHALQQPDRLRHRPLGGAGRRAGPQAPQRARGQGVERRRAAGDRRPRAARRPAGAVRGARRHDPGGGARSGPTAGWRGW